MGTLRHDPEAEKAVIGAVLLDQRALDEVTLEAGDFHLPMHEDLWTLIISEARAGRPTDPVALSQRLGAVKGVSPQYLHECLAAAPTAAVAAHYADIVRGLAHLRRIQTTANTLAAAGDTAPWDAAEQAIDNARADLERAANAATGVRVRTFADVLADAIQEWRNPAPKGIPTGWPDLDYMLNGGWRPGQLTILGARPAVGKSAIAGCAAVAAATRGVGFFSLEMREQEVAARIASATQGILHDHLAQEQLDENDWAKIARLEQKVSAWPLYIEEKSRISMAQVRSYIRTWMRRGHVPLIIIDYLQLVAAADLNDSRERQVSRIAEDCKHIAKEFNTHVLALAQVNRNSTHRQDPRPTMADLRESGGIEAHADNIILLHRDQDDESVIELIVSKNRHGQTGTVKLAWRPHYTSANSMASDPGAYPFGMERTYGY